MSNFKQHEMQEPCSNGFPSSPEHPVRELEGLAVVGFSLRFPEEAENEAAFWDMLVQGRNVMKRFPTDRMNIDSFYHPDGERLDTIAAKGGHFLKSPIDVFDAPFFSITAAEAEGLDPQQRILLETTYRALENAGIPIDKIAGSKTSVHTGCFTNDYATILSRDPENGSKYTAIGTAAAMLANRISWFFDLVGPSVNLDSACSSSMMALDQACQGLWSGDTCMGIVGGCNLVYGIDASMHLSSMSFLSPSSRCFSFDSRGDGYARGEGFGVLIIKRLSDAIRDNDTIRAVIRSTGSNQDGRTPGVTQPSKDLQEQLIKDTYSKAGLDMNATTFFESHGTGTAIGDPTEAGAIGAAFQRQNTEQHPLRIGALKANIGHLEGASGVASLIKTIMVLEKGIIPPIADLQSLNPKIDAEYLRLEFPRKAIPWPGAGLRRASVNSFGFGGANSHAVLDDAYHHLVERHLVGNCSVPSGSTPLIEPRSIEQERNDHLIDADGPLRLLVWSTSDEKGLERLAVSYADHFRKLELPPSDIQSYMTNLAYTLSTRRTSLPWKSFAISRSASNLCDLTNLLSKPVRSSSKLSIGYVLTGQGAQWPQMGRGLLIYPAFRHSLEEADRYLASIGCQWSLLDELWREKSHSNVNSPEFSQPLCTALQVALVDLLRTIGVNPTAVVGHSSGEIAAAYAVRAISAKSAWKISYFRGKFAATLNEPQTCEYGMMAVGLSHSDIQLYLLKLGSSHETHGLTVACVNSPSNITISGHVNKLDQLKELLDEDMIFARKLQVGVAYHSPQMEEIADIYLQSIQDIEPGEVSGKTDFLPMMISSVTGNRVTRDELTQAKYWVQNMVSQVQFSHALSVMCSSSSNKHPKKIDGSHRQIVSINTLLEIGPHAALKGPIRDTLKSITGDSNISYASVLERFIPADQSFLETCGRLFCAGYPIDFKQVNRQSCSSSLKSLVDLPAYQFNHSRSYWCESRLSAAQKFRTVGRHDLLGTPVPDWNAADARWRNIFKSSELPWVPEHKINESPIYPAVGMLVMAIEGIKQLADHGRTIKGYSLKDTSFLEALDTSRSSEGVETQTSIKSLGNTWSEFEIRTFVDGEWVKNCRGSICLEYDQAPGEMNTGQELEAETTHLRGVYSDATKSCKPVDASFMYQRMIDFGYSYGPAFRSMKKIACSNSGEAIAEVQAYQWLPSTHFQAHVIHPTTFDGILQLVCTALTEGGTKHLPTIIPTYIHKLWISDSGLSPTVAGCSIPPLKAHVKADFVGFRGSSSSLFVLDAENNLRMTVEALETTLISGLDSGEGMSGETQRCFAIDWKPDLQILDPEQILEICQPDVSLDTERVNFYEDLTLVLRSFICKALDAIDVRDLEKVPIYLIRYIGWMERQLATISPGILPESWSLFSPSTTANSESFEKLCQNLNKSKQGRLFVTVGRNLPKILSGQLDPLSLLFQGDLVKDYYHDIFDSVHCIPSLTKYLDSFVHANPATRILEVGAGTGGMTRHILKAISHSTENDGRAPRYAGYEYTDISPSFFEKAQETFSDQLDRMSFKTFNVEDDPLLQGFEEKQYDIIVASSVLHATKDLDITLQNIRKLLKPGGKLVLFEITQPNKLRAGFVFGLLPGWWLGIEQHRLWNPCVTKGEWNEALLRTGFSGSELIFDDYEDPLCHEMSIIISTAVDTDITKTVSAGLSTTHVMIVIDTTSALQVAMSSQIRAMLQVQESFECEMVPIADIRAQTDLSTVYIFLPELESPLLSRLDETTFEILRDILSTAQAAMWVTSGGEYSREMPDYGMIDGLARVVRSENEKLKFATLALNNHVSSMEIQANHIVKVFLKTISSSLDDYEPEYQEVGGVLQISRAIEAKALDQEILTKTATTESKIRPFGSVEALKLTIGFPGLLDTLTFVEDEDWLQPLRPDEIEVEVLAVGVNFKDCLVALGRVNQETLGLECVGIVRRAGQQTQFKEGDRVIACALNLLRTIARIPRECACVIPDNLSFKDASAMCTNFTTAWYALNTVARLQPGETVLIHSGAGGTGQAAIQVAQYIGAEIYATVSSKEKQNLLTTTYGIPPDHIFNSRDTSFAQGIRRMTGGKGVKVVLNSLAGDSLVASWELMALHGRFIEIGIKDILSHEKLPMFPFAQNVSFHAIDISLLAKNRSPILQTAIEEWMSLYAAGKFKPAYPVVYYSVSNIEEAFRTIQGGKNVGKMVIEMRAEDPVMTTIKTKPTCRFSEAATYLICGGLGGLGRSIARWMVSQGAKHLILISRSGPQSEAAIKLLDELREKDVKVQAPACDVTNIEMLGSLLAKYALDMPPVRGCIQAAMVLRDSTFANMSFADWSAAITSKVHGSWNLHTCLGDLDFFILLSSITGVLGSAGQANYAAGNSYLDSLARYRVSRGQKAVSLDLGVMKGEGFLAENEAFMKRWIGPGYFLQVSQEQLFALLDYYCDASLPILPARDSQLFMGVDVPSNLRARGIDDPYWMRKPLLRQLYQIGNSVNAAGPSTTKANYATLLAGVQSFAEARQIIVLVLQQKLSKAFGIPEDGMQAEDSMHVYGVDSLVAVELRNWFAKEFGVEVAVFDLLGGATFAGIAMLVAGKSPFVKVTK
ncbi:hypothetical protein B7494_g783 [Chlorociboria aeruginascens]|nr:hypothetical protein B7494_g783 [Chlorociboria aeruginascens]